MEYQTVGVFRRFVSFVIDFLLFLLIFLLLKAFLPLQLAGLTIALLFVLYRVYFITTRGATIGMKVLKIRVINQEGQNPSLGTAVIREGVGALLWDAPFNIGYAWIVLDKRNQGWHDKLAKTFVVAADASGNIKPREKPTPRFVKRLLLFILLALLLNGLLIFMLIYLFIAQPVEMVGNAMAPNYPGGGHYMVGKFTYNFGNPQRGDVAMFRAPFDSGEEFIKRIVGLPGEKIMLSAGRVYVDGRLLEEPYLAEGTVTEPGVSLGEGGGLLLEDDSYFVLGDNRAHSLDSRAFGPIKREDIVGKVWFKYGGP